MTVKDYYAEAIIGKFHPLQLIIEYLAFERKVLKMTDNKEKLTYYLQEIFHTKMNEYLRKYEEERYGRQAK